MTQSDDTLQEILRLVKASEKRMGAIETTLKEHGAALKSLKSSSLASVISLQAGDVDKACGIPDEIDRPNQLLGENEKAALKRRQSESYDKERSERQKTGARIFACYCIAFASAVFASAFGYVPELPFERLEWKDAMEWNDYFTARMHYPFLFAIVYVFVIFFLQHQMRDREEFNLRKPLALWSFCLAVFSFLGAMRTVPAVVRMLYGKGFDHVVCGDTRSEWVYNSPAGWWTCIFILSKIPELVDTLFIVLRKRRLITLHWYHHITVMLFCWHSWATFCLNGIVYSAMNLTVHAVMYFFYTCTALGYRPTAYAQFITILQIMQMLVGTAVTTYVNVHINFIHKKPFTMSMAVPAELSSIRASSAKTCHMSSSNAFFGMLMYASYLWLFCVFYYRAYVVPRRAKKKKSE